MNRKRRSKLERIYDKIPKIKCEGKCFITCGELGLSKGEYVELTRISGKAPKVINGECNYLVDNKCTVYKDRPSVCFLPDTWIFTIDGPKLIKEIVAGDVVYGSTGRLCKVTATQSRIYKGRVNNIRYAGNHVDCVSTTDHLWMSAFQLDKRSRPKPQWKEAGQLVEKRNKQRGDYLCFPRLFEDVAERCAAIKVEDYVRGVCVGDRFLPYTSGKLWDGREYHAIPCEFAVDDEFLFMIGLYLAEGSASGQTARFTMHVKEKPILERIERYLQSLGIKTKINTKRNTSELMVCSCVFARFLAALCGGGSVNKAIEPGLLRTLNHAQRWKIFEGWYTGDGRKISERVGMSGTSISVRLIMQMMFIALSNNLIPRLYAYYPGHRVGSVTYTLHLFPSNWRAPKPGQGTKVMYDDEYVYLGLQSNTPDRYEGPVIDIQVEGDESFVTSSGVVHNCRLYGVVENMRCPYGCEAERILTEKEARAIMDDISRFFGESCRSYVTND